MLCFPPFGATRVYVYAQQCRVGLMNTFRSLNKHISSHISQELSEFVNKQTFNKISQNVFTASIKYQVGDFIVHVSLEISLLKNRSFLAQQHLSDYKVLVFIYFFIISRMWRLWPAPWPRTVPVFDSAPPSWTRPGSASRRTAAPARWAAPGWSWCDFAAASVCPARLHPRTSRPLSSPCTHRFLVNGAVIWGKKEKTSKTFNFLP